MERSDAIILGILGTLGNLGIILLRYLLSLQAKISQNARNPKLVEQWIISVY
jgi:hypothetical protein